MTKIQSVREIISTNPNRRLAKNIAYEFQDFGVRLAQDLNDLRRKSFYIRISKQFKRADLERARDYALGYDRAKSKAKIFMWFLKEMGVLGGGGPPRAEPVAPPRSLRRATPAEAITPLRQGFEGLPADASIHG